MSDEAKDPQAALYAALAKFQAELPEIGTNHEVKTAQYSYTYADLAVVSLKVLPLLAKHGLAFLSKPTLNAEGKLVLAYKLVHAEGGCEAGEYPITSGAAQAVGSAITYARRYALYAVTGVFPAGEDDDGKRADDGYRHSAGQPSGAAGSRGGQVTRAQGQTRAPRPRPAPDLIGDWQVSIDALNTRDEADKLLADLRGQYSARTVRPAVATAVSDAIRAKAATLPGLEVPA